MTNKDLFIVRARTKRGRVVYFLADFDSLISHKHFETVQYFDENNKKWINFNDIENGTKLCKNVNLKKLSLSKLGGPDGNVYYGFEVKFIIYDENKKEILTKISNGNPTEFYSYLKKVLVREGYNIDKLYYQAIILDTDNWYISRIKNEKRKGESKTNFTLMHY